MPVVLNHDGGLSIWCARRYSKELLKGFFDLLTKDNKDKRLCRA
jgi:hypothetical protein